MFNEIFLAVFQSSYIKIESNRIEVEEKSTETKYR